MSIKKTAWPEPWQRVKYLFFEADRGTMPTERKDLTKTSYLRKLVGYAHTYRHDLHAKRYNLPNVRVLTVTPGRQRIANIIAAYRQHAAALVSPKFFLFADRPGLARAEDFLDYRGSTPPASSTGFLIDAARQSRRTGSDTMV